MPQSPFRDFVGEYKDKVVLVLGGQGEKARGMALEYGFEHVWDTFRSSLAEAEAIGVGTRHSD